MPPDGRRAGAHSRLRAGAPMAYSLPAHCPAAPGASNGDQLTFASPSCVAGVDGEKLKHLIQAYFNLGGMQVQFNVVNTQALREAQKKPEAYKDLIVRIAGFSTYFVTLDRRTQDDFISRTEQAI